MKLVAFTRPDNEPVWINPEHVVRVLASTVDNLKPKVEITLVSGMQAVIDDIDDVVSKLSG